MQHTTPKNINQVFFNLSDVPTPNRILYILKHGTKHIPITKSPTAECISSATEKFKNSTAWQSFYLLNNNNSDDQSLNRKLLIKRPASNYNFRNPKLSNKHLESAINKVEEMFEPLLSRENPISKDNFRSYLNQFLHDNPQVIFKLSDKNLGLVLLNLQDYNIMVHEHLKSDKYQLISNNTRNMHMLKPIISMKASFKKLLKLIMRTELISNDNQIFQYARYYERYLDYKLPNFHVLPKLHKQNVNSRLPPSRPIVGAVDWYTTVISKILDHLLKPKIEGPNILYKTTDLASKLKTVYLNPNTDYYLVTMDVSSLYTNINTAKLNEIIDQINPDFGKLSRFITDNNFFQYDDRIFRQTDGIAMGTNVAPTLANLYLLTLLDPTIEQNNNVLMYKRYLDDLFIIWRGTLQQLDEFTTLLNQLVPGIKLEPKKSTSSIEFLDLEIMLSKTYYDQHNFDNELNFKTYHKILNTFSYITPKSMHPTATLKGFIKAELLRFRNNSSNHYYFAHTKAKFYKLLLLRGYKRHYLNAIFNSIQFYSNNPNDDDTRILPIIVPYSLHSGIPTIKRKIYQLNQTLAFKNPARTGFPFKTRVMLAFSKAPNISQILTKTKLNNNQATALSIINEELYSNDKCSEFRNPFSHRLNPRPPPDPPS